MPPKVIPPRLHVLIASEAPYAVVLRRWPSKETTTFGWDLTTDTFTYGQWVKARIYPEKCDLSPDGKHLLYFAIGGDQGYKTYFGVSRSPYVKALGFYTVTGTWTSGGNWLDSKTFFLESVSEVVREPEGLRRVNEGVGRLNPLFYRLKRCGWVRPWEVQDEAEYVHGSTVKANVHYVKKFLRKMRRAWTHATEFGPSGKFFKRMTENWILQKTVHASSNSEEGKAYGWEDHKLLNKISKLEILKPDWEWADYDAPRDRILYAEKGKIFAVKLTHEGLGEPLELFDSTQYGRDPVIAPY